MTRSIEYGTLMHEAMIGVIRSLLKDVAQNGLPGAHHFYITFETTCPGVEMAKWLHERYPGEMTIVIQSWFDNLIIEEDHFAITLNFEDSPEPLIIPYDALRTFVDPSVEFGLRFEARDSEPVKEDEKDIAEVLEVKQPGKSNDSQVVSLDTFRKR